MTLLQVCAGGAAEAIPPVACGGPRWIDLGLALAVVAVGAFGVRLVVTNERRRKRAPSVKIDRVPYLTGGALGILFALSLVVLAHPVGVSGAVQNLAGALGHRAWPTVRYWGEVIPLGLTWQVWVVLGVFVGALVSSTLAGTWRRSLAPEPGSVPRRWLAVLAGAMVLELSAAIAGGCTSGLALSGGVVLAPGAFVFMAAMFATGVPAARWWSRR